MKHSAIIQKEFVKAASDWDDLSNKEQRQYLHDHPKSKRRLTAKPEVENDFDPGMKAVDAFLKNQEKFAKHYLDQTAKVIKNSFPNAEISEIVSKYDDSKGNTVKFKEPIKIGEHEFDISINLSYPKIRCQYSKGEVLDSQQPNSLVKKMKQLLKDMGN